MSLAAEARRVEAQGGAARFAGGDVKKLAREINKVRQQGWSLVVEELEIGAFGISVPIRDTTGATVAAINLSTNLARHSPQELVKKFLPPLQRAALQIGEHLV